jgi:hypothetical protein
MFSTLQYTVYITSIINLGEYPVGLNLFSYTVSKYALQLTSN